MAIRFTDCTGYCDGAANTTMTAPIYGPLKQPLDVSCWATDPVEEELLVEVVFNPEVSRVIREFNASGWYVDLQELTLKIVSIVSEQAEEFLFESGWEEDIDLDLVVATTTYVPLQIVDKVPSLLGPAVANEIPF